MNHGDMIRIHWQVRSRAVIGKLLNRRTDGKFTVCFGMVNFPSGHRVSLSAGEFRDPPRSLQLPAKRDFYEKVTLARLVLVFLLLGTCRSSPGKRRRSTASEII